MSQQSIMDFLEKHSDTWFKAPIILKEIGLTSNNSYAFKSLRKTKFILWKTERKGSMKYYLYKHKPEDA